MTAYVEGGLLADGSAAVSSTAGRTYCGYVQLWAGGPKWATFNVGATITDYANLTIGADATSFNNNTDQAPYYNTANCGGLYAWNQPNYNGRQTTWTSSVTTGVADVATTLWGSNWKIPTRQQLDTLQNSSYGKTTWTWCDGSTTQYVAGCTLKGYKVSGVGAYADKCIFLPAAGYFYYNDATVDDASYYGDYWSGTVYDSYSAYSLSFYSSNRYMDNLSRGYGRSVRAVLVEDAPSAFAGVEMVDLGLPSGIKWANMNVGANAPEEYGDYFAWGETEPKSEYSYTTYKYSTNGDLTGISKYSCPDGATNGIWYESGTFIGDDISTLESEDDAASVIWGARWRMPTIDEWTELAQQCTWIWTTQNGINGYRITADNGNSIFLPAAGWRSNAELDSVGSLGHYWASSRHENGTPYAWYVDFDMGSVNWLNNGRRMFGHSVRPVCPPPAIYTINFVNYDGTLLASYDVEEGVTPVYRNAIPVKLEDVDSTYSFSGWSPSVVAATEAATYTAQFIATAKGTAPANVEMVDLGLSVKWANMNVGATMPEEYGDYFAWGEVTTKNDYSWNNYRWCNGNSSSLTKYCSNGEYGIVDYRSTLEPADDAAHINWGGYWRMPTDDEWNELYTQCTWTLTTQNGVTGYCVSASNGNSIFLPAAGVREETHLFNIESNGLYWSASTYSDDSNNAQTINYGLTYAHRGHSDRYRGLSVRPVCPSPTTYTITYTASSKLSKLESLRADAFGVGISSHTFVDGNGVITFANTIVSIGDYAFAGCTGLTSITIPESVMYIGIQAFKRCKGLTSVTAESPVPAKCASISTFSDVDKTIPLYVPEGSEDLYRAAIGWNRFSNIMPIQPAILNIEVVSSDESMGDAYGGGIFDRDSAVLIFAIPADGYKFVTWSDGVTSNPRTILATSNYTFTAEFAPEVIEAAYEVNVSSENLAWGSATAQEAVVLTAMPEAGYKFLMWSDGNTENPRTVILTENINITAMFVPDAATEVSAASAPESDLRKELIQGKVYITRDGSTYTVLGTKQK